MAQQSFPCSCFPFFPSLFIPAGFVGTPEDVGELAVFLASDASRYIVGQTYTIDGGQMCNMYETGSFKQPREWAFGKGYVAGV